MQQTLQTAAYKIYFVFLLNTKHLQMGQTICGIVWGGVSLYSIPGGIVPSLGGSRKSQGGKPHAGVHSGGKPKGERVSRFPDVPFAGYHYIHRCSLGIYHHICWLPPQIHAALVFTHPSYSIWAISVNAKPNMCFDSK